MVNAISVNTDSIDTTLCANNLSNVTGNGDNSEGPVPTTHLGVQLSDDLQSSDNNITRNSVPDVTDETNTNENGDCQNKLVNTPPHTSSLSSTELPDLPNTLDNQSDATIEPSAGKNTPVPDQPPQNLSSTTAYSADELPDVMDKIAYNLKAVLPKGVVFSSSENDTTYRSKLRPAPRPRRLSNNSKRSVDTVNYADTNRATKHRLIAKPVTSSNRPGKCPSHKLVTSHQCRNPSKKPTQTYNVIPIKGKNTDDNNSDDDAPLNGHDTEHNEIETKGKNPIVTSTNTDIEEDDIPLSQLCVKLKLSTPKRNGSPPTTTAKFKLKKMGIPLHRKADKICPICKVAKTSDDSL